MVIVNERQYQKAKAEFEEIQKKNPISHKEYEEYYKLYHAVRQYEKGPHEMMACECSSEYYPLDNAMQYASLAIIAFLITMLAIV